MPLWNLYTTDPDSIAFLSYTEIVKNGI